jgi:AmmeMemoRadiSam system protein A
MSTVPKPRTGGASVDGFCILSILTFDMPHSWEATKPDPFVDLATRTVHAYVTTHRTLPVPDPIPMEMRGRAGVFVSIKKHGQLRGCIGTFFPTEPTIAHEVIANAIKSATSDPRFPAVKPSELADLILSVDVLSEPEPCTQSQLDPGRYGVIVESGWRRGLLLPDLEGVDSVDDQVAIARSKAGIRPGEPATLARFTVVRHQ